MEKSESIAALAGALAKAQAEIQGAKKDSENPFFKTKYADLSSVWDACRVALTKNGLSIVQPPHSQITENATIISVQTMLMHSSGEWISEELSAIPVKDDPQGIGSCVTYLRRYALSAFTGVAPEDDDGQAASQGNGSARPAQRGAQKANAPQKPDAAETRQIKEALVNTCKLLNSAGDKPTWGAKRLDEFAVQEYGAKADDLEIEPLRELLKKLSIKYDEIKKKPAGDPTEVERQAMIAKIAAAHDGKLVTAALKEKHNGVAIEQLTLDALIVLNEYLDEQIPF